VACTGNEGFGIKIKVIVHEAEEADTALPFPTAPLSVTFEELLQKLYEAVEGVSPSLQPAERKTAEGSSKSPHEGNPRSQNSAMSMLAFMPWCGIDKAYEMGCVRILPVEPRTSIQDLDDAGQCRVNMILATYKTIEGRPVDRSALVRYIGKSPIDDLNEAETSVIRDLVVSHVSVALQGANTLIHLVHTATPIVSRFIFRSSIRRTSARSRLAEGKGKRGAHGRSTASASLSRCIVTRFKRCNWMRLS
jgi:hypothetical protein